MTTTDTSAPPSPPARERENWPERARAAKALLDGARLYMRQKADYTFRPSLELERLGASGGTRGSSTIAAYLGDYLAIIDKATERGVERFGNGKPENKLTPRQAALAYEWAMERLKAMGLRLMRRHSLCDYGMLEFCMAVGTPVPEREIGLQYRVAMTVQVPGVQVFGRETPRAAAETARNTVQQVIDGKLKQAVAQALAGGEIALVREMNAEYRQMVAVGEFGIAEESDD
jgi:hypothetical protein